MTHYPIEDFVIQFGPQTKTGKYLFTSPDYSLNQGYPWGVTYAVCDDEQRVITDGMVYISEEEAASWGTDDMYIINLVAQKAGVTLA